MRVLGITAEYNPFHNGHVYHLKKALEMTGADHTVAAMSGDFTQRGEAALMDKWTRSRLAVENGVDVVFELPFISACSPAETFCAGAVDLLKDIGVTDIAFGSESGDRERLTRLVADLERYKDRIDAVRQEKMKEGDSFARSFQSAAAVVLGEEEAGLMRQPNDILAVEYMKRIKYWNDRGCDITPCVIRRHGSGYDTADETAGFAGASYIRKKAEEGAMSREEMVKYMPGNVADALCGIDDPKSIKSRVMLLLKSELTKKSSSELAEIRYVGEGIENRLKKEVVRAKSLDSFISSIVSRRYTEAAVKRLLIYILMGIKKSETTGAVYGRVLAANGKGREFLRHIKDDEGVTVPVITNVNKETEMCRRAGDALRYDMLASDLYNIIHDRDIYKFSDKVAAPYMGT